MSHIDELAAQAKEQFKQRFGREAQWVVGAPGRVNLIGEHTDYNDGFVFPMAIDRYTVIAAAASDGPKATVYSQGMDESVELLVDGTSQPQDTVQWWSYVQGTIAGCIDAGLPVQPLEAVILSDVPLGGGLSSSAALEASVATLCEAMTGKTLDRVQKVLLCQKAEHEYAKMPCGIMDQFASIMAQADHALLLDCRSQQAEMVPLTDPSVSVLIVNTNVKHELTGSEYPERRGACEKVAEVLGVKALRDATMEMLDAAKGQLSEMHYRRARHVIGEDIRTNTAADALKAGDWDLVGRMMYESHYSLRDDYEVSCPELDTLVEIAQGIGATGGVIGSRMTGGGFGGCTVSLVQTGKVGEVADRIKSQYQEKTGIKPTIFATRPGQGATIC